MPNLFIIGNGFDLAHNMKTRFNHFRDYLDSNYSEGHGDCLYVPESVIGHHGEDLQCEEEVVDLIKYLLNEVAPDDDDDLQKRDWSEMEDLLGKLNLPECFDNVEPQYDREGDRNYFWEYDSAESICRNMALAIPRITEFLSEWIHTIEIPNSPLKNFTEMIDPQRDLFFTFNYTQTLEKLYGCLKENVCHIHGMASDDTYVQTEQLILGHCGQKGYSEGGDVPYDMGDGLQAIYESLRKNTAEQISLHEDFFEKIRDSAICGIYSFGFAFAEVDMPYMKKICDSINTQNIIWWLDNHSGIERRKEYQKKLRNCGFQGDFRTFTMA